MALKYLFIILTFYSLFSGCTNTQKEGEIKVKYIAHSCFIISDNEKSILIDPFASKEWIGYDFPSNIKADLVLISHPHYDHDGGRFLGEKPYWEDSVKIHENLGEYEIGAFNVRGIKGKHSDPYGKEFGQKNIIWKVEVSGINFVHLGDNGPLTDLNYQELGSVDVLMIPIDGKYHILKQNEIQKIISKLQPKIIIPMHYRIPELEEENKPDDLGEIEPYLENLPNVVRLENNEYLVSKENWKETSFYLKMGVSSKLVKQ